MCSFCKVITPPKEATNICLAEHIACKKCYKSYCATNNANSGIKDQAKGVNKCPFPNCNQDIKDK